MSAMTWLSGRGDGLEGIDDEMKQSIVDFSLLCMYFEATCVKQDARPITLLPLVNRLVTAGADVSTLDPQIAYFRQRYFADGQTTQHFEALNLAELWKPCIRAGLSEGATPLQQAEACVLILNRYRNNLFHGPKWSARFIGDRANLKHGIAALYALIAMHDKMANDL